MVSMKGTELLHLCTTKERTNKREAILPLFIYYHFNIVLFSSEISQLVVAALLVDNLFLVLGLIIIIRRERE